MGEKMGDQGSERKKIHPCFRGKTENETKADARGKLGLAKFKSYFSTSRLVDFLRSAGVGKEMQTEFKKERYLSDCNR